MLATTAAVDILTPVEDVAAGEATPQDSLKADRAVAEQSNYNPSPDASWKDVVARIQQGDQSAMEQLYATFAKGIRFFLCRQLGTQELDDRVHDTFLIVVQAIQCRELREPERLMGFVRTVVRRQVAAYIEKAINIRRDHVDIEIDLRIADSRHDPERSIAWKEKVEFMREILAGLSARDREILTRFYLREEAQEGICAEMNLSETQFRLLKSRAKARFGTLGRRRLQQQPLLAFFVRTSGAATHQKLFRLARSESRV